MQGRPSGLRTIVVLAAACCALAAPQAASGAIGSVLGGDVGCNVQEDGVRFCGSSNPRSTTKSFDGVPIDVNVAFPPERAGAVDGNYPLIMIFHGYGGGKLGLSAMRPFLERGFATFSMTNRGFRESCGSAASRAADPSGCERGYVRLIDNRYEVRDAQEFAAELADEGLIDPQRIGATGGSYGGGMSMALAALRDRKVLEDGSLVPWTSPAGKAMRIAAAAANIPWTDLAYSLTPNGSTLDYVADASYEGRIGVMKESFTNGLYLSGLAAPGYYAPEGSDPSADITGWRNLLLAGEPYGAAGQAVVDEITTHHSSYYIDDSTKPAPLLISNGFTDDLFPADEAIRFYNRTRTNYPGRRHRDVLRRLRPSARPGQARRHRPAHEPPARLAGPLRGRNRARAAPGRRGDDRDLSRQRPVRRPADRQELGADGEGRDPGRPRRRADDRARRHQRRHLRPHRGRQRLHDRRRGGHPRLGDLPARPGAGGRLHADRRTDGDRRLHAARRHLAGRRAAARRRTRRPGDARRARALAP